MKFPDHLELIVPTIKALKEMGGTATPAEITNKVIELEKYPEEIQTEPQKGDGYRTKLEYRLAWARTYMKKFLNAVEDKSRGLWSLTADGLTSGSVVIAGTDGLLSEDSDITFSGNKCIAHVDNCFSSDDAFKLKGQNIYSSKKNFPEIPENQYYVNDLVGCKTIFKKNNMIGEVINVKNFGAGDLLEVKLDNKFILIPFNNENNICVNLSKKEIILDPISGILD